jgi:hypothetical protein
MSMRPEITEATDLPNRNTLEAVEEVIYLLQTGSILSEGRYMLTPRKAKTTCRRLSATP